jgi:glutamine amidotransferase
MTVAIIDHGSGNLRSAAKAFEHAGADVVVTASADDVARASRIVLPGVGAFGDCRAGLMALDGMAEALEDAAMRRGVPFLGICVGMQLMAQHGLEGGAQDGLGWIEGIVEAIVPEDETLKIPHMGWNNLRIHAAHPLLAGLGDAPHMYFVHGFHLAAARKGDVLATADYGGAVTAVVGRDNIAGTQFHPEKSQALGLRLIENFLTWKP